MDIVIECNCVIFRWLLLNSKCAKSIFENLVNRHLMIFTHSHSKSRTPILKVAIYIGAHLGPILRVAPILKVQFPTQGCIYSQPKRGQPPLVQVWVAIGQDKVKSGLQPSIENFASKLTIFMIAVNFLQNPSILKGLQKNIFAYQAT